MLWKFSAICWLLLIKSYSIIWFFTDRSYQAKKIISQNQKIMTFSLFILDHAKPQIQRQLPFHCRIFSAIKQSEASFYTKKIKYKKPPLNPSTTSKRKSQQKESKTEKGNSSLGLQTTKKYCKHESDNAENPHDVELQEGDREPTLQIQK